MGVIVMSQATSTLLIDFFPSTASLKKLKSPSILHCHLHRATQNSVEGGRRFWSSEKSQVEQRQKGGSRSPRGAALQTWHLTFFSSPGLLRKSKISFHLPLWPWNHDSKFSGGWKEIFEFLRWARTYKKCQVSSQVLKYNVLVVLFFSILYFILIWLRV